MGQGDLNCVCQRTSACTFFRIKIFLHVCIIFLPFICLVLILRKFHRYFLISLTNLFDVYGANFNFETKDSRRGYKFEKRGKYKSV